MSICFCTLAVHAPYRERARKLFEDLGSVPILVLTDEPADFAGLAVRAVAHEATGPMAADYLTQLPATGNGNGAAAYHDKRFAVKAALRDSSTAIFLDADSRIRSDLPALSFRPGLAVTRFVQRTVAEHLELCGTWRRPAFEQIAQELLGGVDALHRAKWCHESCYAVTKDGNEARFFEAWEYAAERLKELGVFSGEGGVMGVAAEFAGWTVDYDTLELLDRILEHEGGGPKRFQRVDHG